MICNLIDPAVDIPRLVLTILGPPSERQPYVKMISPSTMAHAAVFRLLDDTRRDPSVPGRYRRHEGHASTTASILVPHVGQ